ncbi:MAG: hypothetical protein ABFD44_09400, partial [Anaerolineaceae bacterium]
MNQKLIQLLKKAATVAYSVGGILLIAGMILSAVTSPVHAQGNSTCEPGAPFYRINGAAGQETYTSTASQVITYLYVKAGNAAAGGCFKFTSDGTNGCYTVSGLGTKTVTISRTGTAGPNCQAIS